MTERKQDSRFLNYSRNMLFASIAQVVTILLNFVSRRVFVSTLDIEYLGISGLFSNVLSLLSLTELGVGQAIIYSMYKPISIEDNEKIKSLMDLYRKVYISVGAFMLIAGGFLTPYISHFIKEVPNVPGLKLIFMMFVVQTATTYFFSYKINFLLAIQKNYIIQIFDVICSVTMIILEIAVLVLFKNYYAYLIVYIICPLIKNAAASCYVDNKYPFLREKAQKLEKEECVTIGKNVFALFLYKIGNTLSATIDTIVVSKFLGIVEVAIYYNYHFILSFSDMLFAKVFGTISPSLGNFMAVKDVEGKRMLFSTMQMIYYWISTYLAVGMIVLFNPFMELWLGKEFLFPQYVVVALCVSSTLTNFQRPCSLVRDSNGLFWYGKLRPLAMSIINVVSSIIFVKFFGIIGVVIGTILAKATTFVWYDPYVVYKYVFHEGLKKYFGRYLFQWVVLILNAVVCYRIFYMVNISGLSGFLFGVLIVSVVVNGSFFLICFKTPEFRYVKNLVSDLVKKISKR